ncbi:ribosomal protein S18-alanine N-acetyltransferase [Candidatus Avelusimicrobium faecicola]|uniref:ribosomal protein S18-alanine N-acetyltransferase n=1 Tax=Candidatus Avelusimicrobium faecicola TaxID=3416205 RepID=UPI0015A0C1EC
MEFLPAVFAQAEELARIEARQPFAAGWGEDGFAGELKQPCAVIWAARDGQKTVGFICARYAADEAEILNAAVDPAFTRRGIATALMAQLLAALAARGVKRITLEVHAQNFPAQAWYRRAGFTVLGRRKQFYGSADALLMGKML